MKKIKSTLIVLVALLMFAVPVFAFEIYKGSDYTLDEGKTVDDNLYVFTQTATIKGEIKGDAIIFSQNVSVSGVVEGDLVVVASDFNFNGRVLGNLIFICGNSRVEGEILSNVYGGAGSFIFDGKALRNVRAGGGLVDISGEIGEDLVIGAGEFKLKEKAIVARDLLLGSGDATIFGYIKRNALISVHKDIRMERRGMHWKESDGGSLILAGKIDGNLKSETYYLKTLPTFEIKGDFTYSAFKEELSKDAKILGKVTKAPYDIKGRDYLRKPYVPEIFKIIGFLGFVLLGLLLVFILKEKSFRLQEITREKTLNSFLFGILSLVAIPIVLIILLITIVGIPIALISLILYIMLIYFSSFAVALWVGKLIQENIFKNLTNVYLQFLVGVLLLNILQYLFNMVPVLGPLFKFFILALGMGAIVIFIYEKIKKPFKGEAVKEVE